MLDTTRRCQLECWYCHSSSGPDYRGPTLDPGLIPEIFDTADRLRVFDIGVTGGEPTMWPGLLPLLEHSRRLQFAALHLITNGLSTPPNVLAAIESANLSRICVSLDGVADVHDRNRGAGMFEQTMRGIRELRRVNDNVTVISVIDGTNHMRWLELTEQLAELGVAQHHLTPVCFAGHAMGDYHGLSADQFAEVHSAVLHKPNQLPGITVRFNDTLVYPPAARTMAIHQFTEIWKGWMRIVRPDGDVRTVMRAWGRSWRADETTGNLSDLQLSEILTSRARTAAPFTRPEEVARKFHLGADAPMILADLDDICAVEKRDRPLHPAITGRAIPAPQPLGTTLDDLTRALRSTPDRYRLRREDGFTMVFDTVSHDLVLLEAHEAATLDAELRAVPA
ncbi:radical SAM protein [Nocardia mexicana]|uniref:radical SAM protein n=1 Tax=Nocardia mexicana TaxID=279262 RepID=UPI0014719D16|nr:radical SAM protein [Nocardia mexicana]